jgi:L-seryl-tRNA(Ser) seleniumtransferase
VREIPVLAMLTAERSALEQQAHGLAAAVGGEVVRVVGRVGGGALPLFELEGAAVALDPPGWEPQQLAAALRQAEPPLITRILDGRVIVDPRTLAPDELELAAGVIATTLGGA